MSREHDPSENELTAAERSTERALAALTPAAPRIDRDRLMFAAGQASASPADQVALRSRRLAWPAAAAAFAVTSLALLIALLVQPASPPQIVYLDRLVPVSAPTAPAQPVAMPVAATPSATPSTFREPNYVRTRDVALRLGLDALGSIRGGGENTGPAPTYRALLEALAPQAPLASPVKNESPQM